MRAVGVRGEGWHHSPVMEAEGFLDRLRGLRALEPGSALLIETSGVHGIGVTAPFQAIGLTADLRVVRVVRVDPGRAVRFPGCAFVLELPVDVTPPGVGVRLEVVGV